MSRPSTRPAGVAVRRRRFVSQMTYLPTMILLAAFNQAFAQTSRPAEINHDELVANAKKDPVFVAPLVGKDGRKLTESQEKKIAEAKRFLEESEKARIEGDFAKAAELADRALKESIDLLDGKHHIVVSANGMKATMQARAAMPKTAQEAVHRADFKVAEAKRLHEAGQYDAAKSAALEALAVYEKELPPNDVDTAAALFAAGTSEIELGYLDEADLHLGNALSIYQAGYGSNHPILGKVYDRLGWLYIYLAGKENFQGPKAKQALEYFNKGVRTLARTVGETAELAESLDNRGTIQVYLGNQQEGIRDKIRAFVIREQVLGPEARDTGVSYSNLGWLYGQVGRTEYVVPMRTKALEIFKKSLPEDHPYFLLESGNLARDLIKQGRLNDAIVLMEELHARDNKRNDPMDIGAADRLVELGETYVRAGRVDDGIRLFGQAMARAEKLRDSGRKLEGMGVLNRLLRATNSGRLYSISLPYFEKAVAWDNEDRGRNDSMEYIARAAAVGAVQLQNNQFEEAKRTLSGAIERMRKIGDKYNVELAGPMLNLAKAYSMTGELDKAEKLCEEVLHLTENQTGSQSPATGYSMMWLGRINALQGKLSNAEFNFSEARLILNQYAEQDPLGMIRLLQEEARCRVKQNENAKAAELLRDALGRCREWMKNREGPVAKATLLEILKSLLEVTDPADGNVKADREAWQTEARSIYKQLEEAKALTPEEKDWKKVIG